MSAKQQVSDTVFRTKMYFGLTLLGGTIGAVFFALYEFDFPPVNIVEMIKLVWTFYEPRPWRLAATFFAGAATLVSPALLFFSTNAPDAPEHSTGSRVATPWDK